MIKIKGNVPSSKNSKQWVGKYLINSKTVRNYLKAYEYQWNLEENKKKFKEMIKGTSKPYYIGFYFIRDSKRKFDYVNIAQLPLDLMVKYGWIEDDNCTEIIPVFKGYEINKDNSGVIITLEERGK